MKNYNFEIVFKNLIPIIIAYYISPIFIKDTGSGILFLLIIIPGIIILNSANYGMKTKKLDPIYIILLGILFIPTVFIFMNSSALVYSLVYPVIGLISNLIGVYLLK